MPGRERDRAEVEILKPGQDQRLDDIRVDLRYLRGRVCRPAQDKAQISNAAPVCSAAADAPDPSFDSSGLLQRSALPPEWFIFGQPRSGRAA